MEEDSGKEEPIMEYQVPNDGSLNHGAADDGLVWIEGVLADLTLDRHILQEVIKKKI